jgi:hypothetical protein
LAALSDANRIASQFKKYLEVMAFPFLPIFFLFGENSPPISLKKMKQTKANVYVVNSKSIDQFEKALLSQGKGVMPKCILESPLLNIFFLTTGFRFKRCTARRGFLLYQENLSYTQVKSTTNPSFCICVGIKKRKKEKQQKKCFFVFFFFSRANGRRRWTLCP